jgi:hypothetical protein
VTLTLKKKVHLIINLKAEENHNCYWKRLNEIHKDPTLVSEDTYKLFISKSTSNTTICFICDDKVCGLHFSVLMDHQHAMYKHLRRYKYKHTHTSHFMWDTFSSSFSSNMWIMWKIIHLEESEVWCDICLLLRSCVLLCMLVSVCLSWSSSHTIWQNGWIFIKLGINIMSLALYFNTPVINKTNMSVRQTSKVIIQSAHWNIVVTSPLKCCIFKKFVWNLKQQNGDPMKSILYLTFCDSGNKLLW